MTNTTAEENGVTVQYYVTGAEYVLEFDRNGRTAAVVQNIDGYVMLGVCPTAKDDELKRYYGSDTALDHAVELLGASPHDLPVPEDATDTRM